LKEPIQKVGEVATSPTLIRNLKKFASSASSAFQLYPNSTSFLNMKILHTADWHLGKRLENHTSRHLEQVEVLKEIVSIADQEKVDVVLIAGDLFDNFNPPVESIELLYSICKQLTDNGKRPVIAIAGNHDLPQRVEMSDAFARALGIIYSGYPDTVIRPFKTESGIKLTRSDKGFVELQLPHFDYPLQLLLTPYANEYRLRKCLRSETETEADELNNLQQLLKTHWQTTLDKYFDTERVCILMTHLFFTDPNKPILVEPEDEKPILHIGGASVMYPEHIPIGVQYVALGHLHRAHTVSNTVGTTYCPIVYSGSPLAYSFQEDDQQKYVQLIDIEPNQKVIHRKIPLKSGRRMVSKQFADVDTAVAWLQANPNIWVLLRLETDTYLDAPIKKRLYDAHDGLMPIIPLLRGEQGLSFNDAEKGTQKTIQMMFSDYFVKRHAVLPSQAILDLFEEVLGESIEDAN
jgi:exonuclease SbcD